MLDMWIIIAVLVMFVLDLVWLVARPRHWLEHHHELLGLPRDQDESAVEELRGLALLGIFVCVVAGIVVVNSLG